MAQETGGVRMYSVLHQEKTSLRDGRGASVYRRFYLCDEAGEVDGLPVEDAPGSAALVAEGGAFYILNHRRVWCRADPASSGGGGLWRS